MDMYISVPYIYIFYFETGHQERTVQLDGLPCITIFEIEIE